MSSACIITDVLCIVTESSCEMSAYVVYEEYSQWCLVEAGDVSGTSATIFTRPQLLVGSDADCDLYTVVRHTLLLYYIRVYLITCDQ